MEINKRGHPYALKCHGLMEVSDIKRRKKQHGGFTERLYI